MSGSASPGSIASRRSAASASPSWASTVRSPVPMPPRSRSVGSVASPSSAASASATSGRLPPAPGAICDEPHQQRGAHHLVRQRVAEPARVAAQEPHRVGAEVPVHGHVAVGAHAGRAAVDLAPRGHRHGHGVAGGHALAGRGREHRGQRPAARRGRHGGGRERLVSDAHRRPCRATQPHGRRRERGGRDADAAVPGLAAGGGAAHAREQPRSRGRRAPAGPGRLRRDRQGGAQLGVLRRRSCASSTRLGDDETLLVQSGKPVGVFETHADAPRVLIANSNLVPHVGDVGALPRARAAGPDDVRPDDRRVLDLHRHAGDPAGHLRDVRGVGARCTSAARSPGASSSPAASAAWAARSRSR